MQKLRIFLSIRLSMSTSNHRITTSKTLWPTSQSEMKNSVRSCTASSRQAKASFSQNHSHSSRTSSPSNHATTAQPLMSCTRVGSRTASSTTSAWSRPITQYENPLAQFSRELSPRLMNPGCCRGLRVCPSHSDSYRGPSSATSSTNNRRTLCAL